MIFVQKESCAVVKDFKGFFFWENTEIFLIDLVRK